MRGINYAPVLRHRDPLLWSCKHCHFHDVPFQTPSKHFILGWYVSYTHSTVSTLVLHTWILKSLFSDASFQNFGAISNPTRAPAWSNLSSHPAARGSFFHPSVLPSNSVPLTGSFKSLLLSKLDQREKLEIPKLGKSIRCVFGFLFCCTEPTKIQYTHTESMLSSLTERLLDFGIAVLLRSCTSIGVLLEEFMSSCLLLQRVILFTCLITSNTWFCNEFCLRFC